MTAFPVILVQPTCPGGQRAKGVQFQLTCHLYRESHKLEVWLCFLILSFLSTSTCAAPEPETFQLLKCLKFEGLKNAIEKSEAMLYAPSSSDIKENCKMKSLKCYMSELIMVIVEEEIQDPKAHCIFDFNERLPPDHPVDCPPCEAYSLKNIKVFLKRLMRLLQEMNSRKA
ncbi:interleukin-15-like isoform X1 [Pseudoliparis swirei]|uniref:interleukin-15-like isoform X1 n=1 Tax=Pseudoliparis swirei TaxID=2059687 RepID=UPI0024BE0240|nr:interleukin-15-like isoform X1 [Pseudoliparis swirei]